MNTITRGFIKHITGVVLMLTVGVNLTAQELTLTKVNEVENPQHGDNVGSIARTDTVFIEGSYTGTDIQSISVKLLTYQKNPYTKLVSYEYTISEELNGTLDTCLIVPEDYLLGDNPDNSQFVQIRAAYTENAVFANLFLTVTDVPPPHKTRIDFDEDYGVATGSTLVSNINTAMSSMEAGDTILFKSAEYDFEGSSLTVSKPIKIMGKMPTEETSDVQGAYDVKTVFKNLKGYKLTSNDIYTENLELIADASTAYVFTNVAHDTDGTQYYTGLVFKNVIFRDGKVQCFGRNGAGIEFTHVSFINFSSGGYYLNRSESVDSAPQFNMSKCFFQPNFDADGIFNVRGISLDAGNTEYPVVWNQNNSSIDNCLLDGTGLGISSKTSHVNVTNCHFKGYSIYVDMIHIEEFGHHFLIDGNTFEHIKPARGINIDREIQQCHDITITNNKWIGEYGWIISAHSPYNLTMENNDFTEAWAKSTSDKTIDLTYDHGEEIQFTEYDLPATNIIFKNNTGLNNGKHGFFAYKAMANDETIDIDYPADKIQVTTINEAPKSILNLSTYYRIKNKLTGQYLHTVEGESKLEFSAEEKTDSSDVWEFTFGYPYFYHIKNRGTKNYMNVYRGYTMGDYNNSTQEQIFVEQSGFFNQKEEQPRWYLRKHEENSSVFYEILPGGNERKSRNVQVGKYMELEYAKVENADQLPPEDDSSWELIPLKADVSVKDNYLNEKVKVYPNPATTQLNIVFSKIINDEQLISIINSTGSVVLSKEIEQGTQSFTIDVNSFVRGMYMLRINSGESQYSSKVIVK
ncbi:T9SS type A sorting domain-containing protein [Saccharicrinis sp. 156]|uniref:T9SS type A sorting domain-containing protein n=1 Tax=Saccharicrinis sp. 156 TaxID=3417574 RepID=UPI003D35314B